MPKGKQFDFPEPLIFGRFDVRMYIFVCATPFVRCVYVDLPLIVEVHNTTPRHSCSRRGC